MEALEAREGVEAVAAERRAASGVPGSCPGERRVQRVTAILEHRSRDQLVADGEGSFQPPPDAGTSLAPGTLKSF